MLSVHPSSIVKQGVVVFQVPLGEKPSCCAFNILKGKCEADYKENKPPGAEMAALLYSFAQLIEFKTNGSPKDMLKAKLADFCFDVQHKDFLITAVTVSNFSAVRTLVATVLKHALQANKLKDVYKRNLQCLGLKLDEEELMYLVHDLVGGIKKIKILVVGPKIDAEKVKTLGEAIGAVVAKAEDMGKRGKAPAGGKHEPHGVELKGNKLECLLGQYYLRSYKIDSSVHDFALLPQVESPRWPALHNKVKGSDKIKRYVDLKIMKLGEKLGDTLKFMASKSGYFTPSEIEALPTSPTEAQILNALKKHFG